MKPTTTIIQLSGGIDSAYVLYDWLKNNPDEKCIVHHINLKNHEGRAEREGVAVKNILKWLKGQGLDNFTYIESTFDYGNMGYIIKDVEVCALFLGIIVRNEKWTDLKQIVEAIYEPEKGTRHTRAKEILEIVGFNKEISVVYPLKNLSKADVIEMMPEDLLNLCWYCRKPVNNEPCEKCATCKEVENGEPHRA
jgi:7-cyano-7-deazaguanine synthase in queuosine biosynthesis